MDHSAEVNAKHDQIRALLDAHRLDALHIRRPRNVAWFTGGIDSSIAVDAEYGSYTLLVTHDQRTVITNAIEITRLRGEEAYEALGFGFHVDPWYAGTSFAPPKTETDDGALADALAALRVVLTPPEHERLRQLGRDTAAAIEEAANAVQVGDTEYEIAALLVGACRRRGGIPVVALIGTDERISQYRHPFPTGKRLERCAMLVVCNRQHGLVVSATRLVCFGGVPDDLNAKLHKVAAIDAAAMVATRPGRTLGDVFADLQAAYAAHDEADQWTLHHQGGLAGYAPRERVAIPGDPTPIQSGQVFAWNPSIVGAKSEDTILVTDAGFEIVSAASPAFPTVTVSVGGQSVVRPGILER